MSIEINEDNDFEYIQDYLKKEVITDFVKHMEAKKFNNDDLKNIYQHFSHYNSAIKSLLESNQKLMDENELLKSAIKFNSKAIQSLQNYINDKKNF